MRNHLPSQKPNITEATSAVDEFFTNVAMLRKFIGTRQLAVMLEGVRGEEGQFFLDKIGEMVNVIKTMPKTYEQDGLGDKAVAHLHYFKGSGDWYITEKDCEGVQHQAFGSANLGYGAELGYISIVELIRNNVEIDLHFKPTTLAELKKAVQ